MYRIVLLLGCFSLMIDGQSRPPKIEDFSWLAGCWEIDDRRNNRLVSEQWMKPAGGMMPGMARAVTNGKMTVFEFTRIVERQDGIFYIAKPSENREETEFRLTNSGKTEAVFENPKHDFPKRIIYRRRGNQLLARVEGRIDGKMNGIDYPYWKADCP